MFEIRETMTRATCCGSYNNCETYKDHPDWPNLKDQMRHIPKGEKALFVNNGYGGRNFCVCKVHAQWYFDHFRDILRQAEEWNNDSI